MEVEPPHESDGQHEREEAPVEGEEEGSDGSYFVGEDEEEDYGFGSGSFDYSLAARAGDVEPPPASASARGHTPGLELDDFRSSWLTSMTLGSKSLSSLQAPNYLINFLSVRGLFQQVVQSSILSTNDLYNLCLVCSAFLQESQKALFQSITIYSYNKFKKLNAVLLESPHLATSIKSVSLALGDLPYLVSLYPAIATALHDIYEKQDAQEEDYYYADNLGEEQRAGGMQRSVRGDKRWEHELKKKIGKAVGSEEWEERRFRECFSDTGEVKPILEGARDEIVAFLREQYGADPFIAPPPPPPPSTEGAGEGNEANTEPTNRMGILGLKPDFLEAFRQSALRFTPSLEFEYPLSLFASDFFSALEGQALRAIVINGKEPEHYRSLLVSLRATMMVKELVVALRRDGMGVEGLGSTIKELTLDRMEFEYGDREITGEKGSWKLEKCILKEVVFPSSDSQPSDAPSTATLPTPTLYTFLGDQSDHLTTLSLQNIIGISLSEVWDTVRSHSTTLQVLNLGDIGTRGLRRRRQLIAFGDGDADDDPNFDPTFHRGDWESSYIEDADFPARLKANDARREKEGRRIGHTAYELELVSMKQARHLSDKASTALSHCRQLQELVLVDEQQSPTFPISIIDSLLSSRPPKLSTLELRLGIDPSITSFEFKEYKGKVKDVWRWDLKVCGVTLKVGCDSEMEGIVKERLEAQQRSAGANRMPHQRAVPRNAPAIPEGGEDGGVALTPVQ